MGLYSKYVLPELIDWACRQKPSRKQREKVVPLAEGNVLEIGIGSGLNLPFYDPDKVSQLIAIEPLKEVWEKNKVDQNTLNFSFDYLQAFAEELPIDSNSIDSVVITFTLCSIHNTDLAFEEIRRVLKPTGKLIFNEHGKAPDDRVYYWQKKLNPLWQNFSGGCHLHKDIPSLIETAGFKFNSLDSMYVPGWKPASFNYWGVAKTR